jgi:predicted TPR repeat methyltransferase
MLLQKLPLRPSMRVLDFGAGTGLICAHVAPLVDKIYAVDISASMLERLAAKPELQGKVDPICQDILEKPLDREVDLIMSAMAMHHVEDTERLFETFAAHLAPGGLLALADLDKEDGSFHPADVEGVFHHGFDRGEIQALLEKQGFESVEFGTAVEVTREERNYPIFLVTATKH